jgi:hypothetical protein
MAAAEVVAFAATTTGALDRPPRFKRMSRRGQTMLEFFEFRG